MLGGEVTTYHLLLTTYYLLLTAGTMPGGEGLQWISFKLAADFEPRVPSGPLSVRSDASSMTAERRLERVSMRIPQMPSGPLSVRTFHLEKASSEEGSLHVVRVHVIGTCSKGEGFVRRRLAGAILLTTHLELLTSSPTPLLQTTLFSLLTAHCSLLTAHCSLLTAHRSPLTPYHTHRSQHTSYHTQLTEHYIL